MLALLLCSASLAVSGYSLYFIVRALRARSWPVANGEIVSTRVVGRDDEGSVSTHILYRYEVDGRAYRNDRVSLGVPVEGPTSIIPGWDPPADRHAEAALASEYPRGGRVRVFYNPRRPEESVLEPAPHWTLWTLLVLGGMFLSWSWGAALRVVARLATL